MQIKLENKNPNLELRKEKEAEKLVKEAEKKAKKEAKATKTALLEQIAAAKSIADLKDILTIIVEGELASEAQQPAPTAEPPSSGNGKSK